jgi:prophage regulatory protein
MQNKTDQVYVPDTFLSQRYGVARQTVWRWVQSKNFPAPKKFSPGCSRWFLPEVEQWEKSRPEGV